MFDKPDDFMQYMMQSGTLVCEHYEVQIDDLLLFGHERSSISHQIIVLILYTELAWVRGHPYMFPVIPPQLEREKPHPDDIPLPVHPKEL